MIYAYVNLTITDPDALAKYRENAGAALARHGGKPLVSAKETTVLEGSPTQPSVAVILEFSDRDAALGWINDREIADVHALRRAAGQSDILLLG